MDEDTRRLERSPARTLHDSVCWLRARLARGDLTQGDVALAAHFGDEASQLVVDAPALRLRDPATESYDLALVLGWSTFLVHRWGSKSAIAFALHLAATALPEWESLTTINPAVGELVRTPRRALLLARDALETGDQTRVVEAYSALERVVQDWPGAESEAFEGPAWRALEVIDRALNIPAHVGPVRHCDDLELFRFASPDAFVAHELADLIVVAAPQEAAMGAFARSLLARA